MPVTGILAPTQSPALCEVCFLLWVNKKSNTEFWLRFFSHHTRFLYNKTRSKPSIWLDHVWSMCYIVAKLLQVIRGRVYNVNSWILDVHLQFSVVVPVKFVLKVYWRSISHDQGQIFHFIVGGDNRHKNVVRAIPEGDSKDGAKRTVYSLLNVYTGNTNYYHSSLWNISNLGQRRFVNLLRGKIPLYRLIFFLKLQGIATFWFSKNHQSDGSSSISWLCVILQPGVRLSAVSAFLFLYKYLTTLIYLKSYC